MRAGIDQGGRDNTWMDASGYSQHVLTNSSTLEAPRAKLPDQDRVADLIAEQQRDGAD